MTGFTCTDCIPEGTTMPPLRAPCAPPQSLCAQFSWPGPTPSIEIRLWQRATEAWDPMMAVVTIEKSVIEHGGRRFKLLKPLELRVRRHDEQWIFEAQEPDVSGCADTVDEALRELSAQFAYLWDEFGNEDDARLGAWARVLKRQIRGRVSRVEPLP